MTHNNIGDLLIWNLALRSRYYRFYGNSYGTSHLNDYFPLIHLNTRNVKE